MLLVLVRSMYSVTTDAAVMVGINLLSNIL